MGQNICISTKTGDVYKFHHSCFAEGSSRKAYRCEVVKGPNLGKKGVVKRYKDQIENKKLDNFKNEQLIWQQASVYARLFNKEINEIIENMKTKNFTPEFEQFIKKHYRRIVMPQPQIIQIEKKSLLASLLGKHYKEGDLISLEQYLEGEYRKFNSNSGWSDENYPLLQAFSHFTYYNSGGQEILCDLQGVDQIESQTIQLTDPAILSIRQRFGDCDIGYQKLQYWIKNHKCNHICHALNLNDFKLEESLSFSKSYNVQQETWVTSYQPSKTKC
ncbi:hypothetical protein ABPG74_020919 [Tetrahymena malaccensis]